MEKSYMEKITNFYHPYQQKLMNAKKQIEKFQNNQGFQPIDDVTIRCTNALMRTSKYLKQHNFDYRNEDITNSDNILMSATEKYIFAKYIEAQKILNEYVSKVITTANEISNSTSFKLFQEYKIPLAKAKLGLYKQLRYFIPKENLQRLLITKYEIRSKFVEYQELINNYEEIAENITKFEIENNVYDVLEFYLPNLYNCLKKVEFSKNDDENRKLRNKIFGYKVTQIVISLNKLNLRSDIYNISKQAEKIMNDDLKEHVNSELVRINSELEALEKEESPKKILRKFKK